MGFFKGFYWELWRISYLKEGSNQQLFLIAYLTALFKLYNIRTVENTITTINNYD